MSWNADPQVVGVQVGGSVVALVMVILRAVQRNSLGVWGFSVVSFSVLCFLFLYYFLLLVALVLICSPFNGSLQWKVQLLICYHSPLIQIFFKILLECN